MHGSEMEVKPEASPERRINLLSINTYRRNLIVCLSFTIVAICTGANMERYRVMKQGGNQGIKY